MSKTNSPLVGILMGSDSDWPTMKAAADALAEFGIASEAKVISAHRDPRGLEEYVSTAIPRGLKVIIAGAGGAAHLPGVTAAFTTLPVIGVPIVGKVLRRLRLAAVHRANAAGRARGDRRHRRRTQRGHPGRANPGRGRRRACRKPWKNSKSSSPRNRARKTKI